MDSSQLTNVQTFQIHQRLAPTATYLGRLKERMEARGFPKDDPVYLAVVAAFRAVNLVTVEMSELGVPKVKQTGG